MAIKIKSASTQPDLEYSASGIGINFTYIASPSLEVIQELINIKTALTASMIECYQTMAAENLKLAEEHIPIVLETWPLWE